MGRGTTVSGSQPRIIKSHVRHYPAVSLVSIFCYLYNINHWYGTYDSGGLTRQDGHVHELNLTSAQEEVLERWIKIQGHRGIPLTHQVIRDYASEIAERDVGVSWSKRFLKRHTDLKMKKTTGLSTSRATALNKTSVEGFYSLLEELVEKFNIEVGNMYNMDEKGVQLGIGAKVRHLILIISSITYLVLDYSYG
jgi:hypothetical protein